MKLSFIGSGKVGTAFGKYISDKHDVLYYYSKTVISAKKAATLVGCSWTDDLKELIDVSDLIFITTSDDQIQKVSEKIASLNLDLTSKHFIHMSGALTTDVFEALTLQGAVCSSLHPLQTFTSFDQGVYDLKNAYLSLESESDVLIAFIESLSNPYFRLTKDQKTTYHLSACIFSNYLVTLFNMGSRMLTSIGIEEVDGLKAMKPLIDATLSNIYNKGTKEALTGPIIRGDVETLKSHMSVLDEESLKIYKALGELTTEHLVEDIEKKSALRATWRS